MKTNVAMRTWTCKGCGYENTQVGTYYKMKKSWDTVHTLEFCKGRKIEIFPGTLDALAKLSVIK